MKGKRILITGGLGFLGSNLTSMLVDDNEIVCFDDVSTGKKNNASEFMDKKGYDFIQGSIMDSKALDRAMKDIDIVFHYAAVVGVKRTLEQPLNVLNVNIEGTRNVLESALKNNVKKVVNISSSEVYGEPVELPEREDGALNAKLPYAVAKHVGELYSEAYYKTYGLKTVSLRFFNVYGPRQISNQYGFVIGIFINQALSEEPLTVFGDGKQTRDFTYVKDNIMATILSAEKNSTDGKSFNIGTGKRTTVLELAEKIVKLTGTKSEIKFLKERQMDIVHRQADITLMKKLLDFEPKYSLDQGLKETITWYRSL